MTKIYDPLEFIDKIQLFTIAIVGSFVTMKLLNSLYENIYEPMIEMTIGSEKTNEYYLKIGRYYVQMDIIIREFIKWILIIIVLMIIYNLYSHKKN